MSIFEGKGRCWGRTWKASLVWTLLTVCACHPLGPTGFGAGNSVSGQQPEAGFISPARSQHMAPPQRAPQADPAGPALREDPSGLSQKIVRLKAHLDRMIADVAATPEPDIWPSCDLDNCDGDIFEAAHDYASASVAQAQAQASVSSEINDIYQAEVGYLSQQMASGGSFDQTPNVNVESDLAVYQADPLWNLDQADGEHYFDFLAHSITLRADPFGFGDVWTKALKAQTPLQEWADAASTSVVNASQSAYLADAYDRYITGAKEGDVGSSKDERRALARTAAYSAWEACREGRQIAVGMLDSIRTELIPALATERVAALAAATVLTDAANSYGTTAKQIKTTICPIRKAASESISEAGTDLDRAIKNAEAAYIADGTGELVGSPAHFQFFQEQPCVTDNIHPGYDRCFSVQDEVVSMKIHLPEKEPYGGPIAFRPLSEFTFPDSIVGDLAVTVEDNMNASAVATGKLGRTSGAALTGLTCYQAAQDLGARAELANQLAQDLADDISALQDWIASDTVAHFPECPGAGPLPEGTKPIDIK